MTLATLDTAAPPVPAGRRRPGARRFPLAALWLNAPLIIILLLLVVMPLVFVIYGALQSSMPGDPASSFTLQSLQKVYASSWYVSTYLGTAALAAGIAVSSTLLGSIFAWLVGRTNVPGGGAMEVLLIAPLFVSPFLGAIAWVVLAGPNAGMINDLYRAITGGGPRDYLINIMTPVGVGFVVLLYYTPYAFVFVLSALRNMDPSLEEASYLNGANKLQTALRVTFPVIRPAVGAAFFFIVVLGCGIFTVPTVLLTSGGFAPLAELIQRSFNNYPPQPALGAALGTVMLIVTSIGIMFYRRSIAQAAKFVTLTGKGFRPRPVRLGAAAKVISVAAMVIFVMLGVVLPYATLLFISVAPYSSSGADAIRFSFGTWWTVLTSASLHSALKNSLLVGIIVPSITVVLGLAVSYAVNRGRGPGRALIDYLSTIPVAVPGLIIGVGMVWAYITTPLYATLALLVIAFVCEYLPYASRMSGNAMLQIDKSLEEASWINGAGKLQTVWKVTVPLVRQTVLATWLMLFIFATREISAAVVLYSPNSTLLSVLSWNYESDGSMSQAAIVGLVQTALMLVVAALSRLIFRVRLGRVAA